MPPTNKYFAETLRLAREDEGLTQQELAERVGVSVLQVKRYEAGVSEPSLDILRRIGWHLGHGVDALIYNSAPETHSWTWRELCRRMDALPKDERLLIERVVQALVAQAEQGHKGVMR